MLLIVHKELILVTTNSYAMTCCVLRISENVCETLLPVCRVDGATRGGHVHHNRTRPVPGDRITTTSCRLHIQRLPDQPVGRRQGRVTEAMVKYCWGGGWKGACQRLIMIIFIFVLL